LVPSSLRRGTMVAAASTTSAMRMARLDDRGTSFFFPVAAPPPPTLQTKAVVVEEAATSRTASLTTDYCRAKTTRHLCTGTSLLHFFFSFLFSLPPACSLQTYATKARVKAKAPNPAKKKEELEALQREVDELQALEGQSSDKSYLFQSADANAEPFAHEYSDLLDFIPDVLPITVCRFVVSLCTT